MQDGAERKKKKKLIACLEKWSELEECSYVALELWRLKMSFPLPDVHTSKRQVVLYHL